MLTYPEDDPNLLNPNRLEGHEGYMIKLLREQKGYVGCKDTSNDSSNDSYTASVTKNTKNIPASSIVMIAGTWYSDRLDDDGWVDMIHEGERLRIFHQPSQWMTWAIPWPHGAFIQVL